MSQLRKVDHITYACERGSIERWTWFHLEVEGGKLINRIDDVRPDDPDSSMKIWCIDFGDFGVALIEGIDRAKKSQVTKFVDAHGDHSVQHVAFDAHDLDTFTTHIKKMGGTPRGQTLVRNDGFGVLKQMFARGYSSGDAAQVAFPEYVQRPDRTTATRFTSPSPRTPARASTIRSKRPRRPATRRRSSTSPGCRPNGRFPSPCRTDTREERRHDQGRRAPRPQAGLNRVELRRPRQEHRGHHTGHLIFDRPTDEVIAGGI